MQHLYQKFLAISEFESSRDLDETVNTKKIQDIVEQVLPGFLMLQDSNSETEVVNLEEKHVDTKFSVPELSR